MSSVLGLLAFAACFKASKADLSNALTERDKDSRQYSKKIGG
jgi:hypothetical protein